jgi:hypothetical protein
LAYLAYAEESLLRGIEAISYEGVPNFAERVRPIFSKVTRSVSPFVQSTLRGVAMYPAPTVRYKLVDGLIVLLDLRTGEYNILNRVASAMWQQLLSRSSHQERIWNLAQQFDVAAAPLGADLTAFAQKCVESGFLQRDAPLSSERPRQLRVHRSALVFRAWWSLLVTTVTLAWRGFAYTYQSYLRLPKAAEDHGRQDELIFRAERAFLRAEDFFLLRNAPQDCLPRSLALYLFLQTAGICADHCIGVRRFPFEAHAWVECPNRVLLNSPDDVVRYSELARM